MIEMQEKVCKTCKHFFNCGCGDYSGDEFLDCKLRPRINDEQEDYSNTFPHPESVRTFLVSFHSGSKESADEKYKTAIGFFVEQELSFEMICCNDGRSLCVKMKNKDYTKFKREFSKLGYFLD